MHKPLRFLVGALLALTTSILTAQSPSRWMEISTERTRILYQAQDEEQAQQVAGFADPIVQRLGEELDYQPEERIPVVLRGRTDQANGYFTLLPKRITLFLSPDSVYPGYFGPSESWLQLVFTHEAAHYIQLTRPEGAIGTLTSIFGEAFTAVGMASLPAWFIEGTAVYLETLLSSGGRGRSAAFAMEMLANIYDLNTWSYDQTLYDSSNQLESRIYRSGALIVAYIAEHYGFETVNAIQKELLRSPLGTDFSSQIVEQLSMSPEELWSRAQRWFAAAFLDQLQIPEGQQWEGLENFRNLTLLSLPVAVDGGQVLHYRDLDSTSSLAFLPEESDEPAAPLAISPRTWSTTYGFDALESTIVFSHREPRTEGRDRGWMNTTAKVYEARLWEGRLAYVRQFSPADGSDYFSPTIGPGPNGTRVLALRRVGDRHQVVELPTADLVYDGNSRLADPQLSPDGKYLAVSEFGSSQSRLLVMGLSDGTTLTSQWISATVEYPRWSPDGSRLTLVSDLDGPRQLYAVSFKPTQTDRGTNLDLRRIHADPVGIIAGEYREDGSLVYSVARSRSQVLMTSAPNGGYLPPDAGKDGGSGPAWMIQKNVKAPPVSSGPTDLPAPKLSGGGFRFATWLPRVFLRQRFEQDNDDLMLDAGPGLELLGQSLTEESLVMAAIGVYLTDIQPIAQILWQQQIGQSDMQLGLNQSYQSRLNAADIPEAVQRSTAALDLYLPLLVEAGPGSSTQLHARLGVQGGFETRGRREFGIVEGLSPQSRASVELVGTSDPEDLVGGPILQVLAGLGLSSYYPAPLSAFYGGGGGELQLVGFWEPELDGGGQEDSVLGGLFSGAYRVAGPTGGRISLIVEAAAVNSANAVAYLGYRAPIVPVGYFSDLRYQTAFEINLPIELLDASIAGVVLDSIGITALLEWGGAFQIPGLRNPAAADRSLAQSLWYSGTGSTIGAPRTSARAAQVLGINNLDTSQSTTSGSGSLPDEFLVYTFTVDLGVGASSLRQLFQAGVSIKVPLSTEENYEIVPAIFFDIGDLL